MVRGLLLARLVGPGAFGLFAGIVAFTSLVGLIAELGLTPYVVFRGGRARGDAAAVATISLASGLVGAAAVALLASPIAEFYGRPDARWIALALSGSVLITTLTAVPMGILRSELKFVDIGISQGLGEIAAVASALVVAILGGGIWALVTAFLVAQTVALAIIWQRSGLGRPRLGANWRGSARVAATYGGPVVGGAILWAVALQGDNVIVGHQLGPTMLGLYAFAYSYGTLPGGIVNSLIGPVAFPTLARIKHDLTEFHRQFVVFVRLSSLIALPAAAVGVALTPAAIDVILGHEWSGAAQPLQLFLVVGALRSLFPTDQVMRALGQTKWELITGLVAAPATVVAALLGSTGNILLVATLVSFVAIGCSIWSTWIGARLMRVGVLQLFMKPLPALVVGATCGLAGWLAALIPAPAPFQLAAGLLAAVGLYVVILRSDRVPGAATLKDLARTRSLLAEPT
jgi:PST family polysaccharide transporter